MVDKLAGRKRDEEEGEGRMEEKEGEDRKEGYEG